MNIKVIILRSNSTLSHRIVTVYYIFVELLVHIIDEFYIAVKEVEE